MDQYTSNVSLMFERFYDDSRGLKAELAKIFVKDFGYDSKKFIAFAQDKAAKKRVQIAHRVGHIGVDISMLAIGASIGAWVAKRKHE